MNHDIVDELVRLMRQHPVETLAAIREARPVSEWRSRSRLHDQPVFVRLGVGDVVVALVYTDERGRVVYRVPGVDAYMAAHEAVSVESGMAACDALLVGWALGGRT